MVQHRGRKNPLKAMALTQQKMLPQLERLIQLLEDGKLSSLFTSAQSQQSSGTTKVNIEMEISVLRSL